MTNFSCRHIAQAYTQIAKVNPPSPVGVGTLELNDIVLLRSVNPAQFDYLATLSKLHGPSSEWERVYNAVIKQKELRTKIYRRLQDLDKKYRDDPSTFIFPDPYTLLLWIWTFQLFDKAYSRKYGEEWRKYFYRGEPKDYGATRFIPTIARHQVPNRLKKTLIPSRIREFIRRHMIENRAWNISKINKELCIELLDTMSIAQGLAAAQHYGFPTPLLDVTINPEIAIYFATKVSEEKFGFVGYLDTSEASIAGNLALIIAPSVFSRILRQSAYFICTPANTKNHKTSFKTLRFKHHPELEPVQPTWIFSTGPINKGGSISDIILSDPLDLSKNIQGEPPDLSLKIRLPNPDIFIKMNHRDLYKSALIDIIYGAGRSGITEDGIRFSDINPVLIYSLLRHSPIHFYIHLCAIAVAIKSGDKSSTSIYNLILRFIREIFIQQASEDNNLESNLIRNLVRGIDDNMWHRTLGWVLGSGDHSVLQWPLNTWYN